MAFLGKLGPSLRTTVATLTWFPVLYSFSNHVYLPCKITGLSMAPTFNPGTETTTNDVALVQKFDVKSPSSLVRGDVIMFRSPNDPEKLLTKRVVGLQGDIILTKTPYPRSQAVIPRNHLWVEGDNAFHSIDSNNFGPISQSLVIGKVVCVIWPPSRFGSDIASGGRDARKQKIVIDDL